jgi:hypothetical protein
MSTKRVGIAAAALLLMTALTATPTSAAPDPGARQIEDFHFRAVGAGGGDSLTDTQAMSQSDVIAKHKERCSC